MNKVAVFGKPGSGKSTFSKQLSLKASIPLYSLDLIEYRKDGSKISHTEYFRVHNNLINKNNWIIEGLGSIESFWQRVEAADTLIYIDLPYHVSYWWVTKRMFKGLYLNPEGWPEGSSILKGTLASFKYLKLSKLFWTEDLYKKLVKKASNSKIYRFTSVKAMNQFISGL